MDYWDYQDHLFYHKYQTENYLVLLIDLLLVYHYQHLVNYIEESTYFIPLTNIKNNYTQIDIKWDGYCKDLCIFYNKFLKSTKNGYIITDVLDMIPTLVKCKNIKKWFLNNEYIVDDNERNKNILTIQINHKIFTDIIILKRKVRNKLYNYITPYRNECKIGLQYRDGDGCVIWNNCIIDNITITNILSHVNKYNRNRSCWLFISSANKLLITAISSRYNKTLVFLPNVSVTHSSVVFNKKTYEKTIGDMIFPSLTDHLIISSDSTYAKVVLYQFYKKHMLNKIFNSFVFIKRNGEIKESELYTALIDNSKSKNCINFPQL